MADPTFPINVPADQLQEDGDQDKEPIFQTHHGRVPGQVRFSDQEAPEVPYDDEVLRREP